jgi:hypothetical protein
LKTEAFTDQRQRMGRRLFSLLFSLCDFEKSENEKSNWYHYSKLRLERVKGIEPSLLKSEHSQRQEHPSESQAGYTQIRAQILGELGPELARVVAAWSKLSPPLKTAILAIIQSASSSEEAAP